MARVHQKQSKNQLRKQEALLEASKLKYYGKLDLAKTYEEQGLKVPRELRQVIHRSHQLLLHKGAI